MMQKLLATTMFTAGVLFAGAAFAQTPANAPMNPAPAQTQSYAPDNSMNWQNNNAAEQRTESVGDTYTTALNDLYSHGFHGVQQMWLQNGLVQATAVTPNGLQRTVTVDPGTGQISLG